MLKKILAKIKKKVRPVPGVESTPGVEVSGEASSSLREPEEEKKPFITPEEAREEADLLLKNLSAGQSVDITRLTYFLYKARHVVGFKQLREYLSGFLERGKDYSFDAVAVGIKLLELEPSEENKSWLLEVAEGAKQRGYAGIYLDTLKAVGHNPSNTEIREAADIAIRYGYRIGKDIIGELEKNQKET